MAIAPEALAEGDPNFGTFHRNHSTLGEQTLVAESMQEAVQMRFNGWKQVDGKSIPEMIADRQAEQTVTNTPAPGEPEHPQADTTAGSNTAEPKTARRPAAGSTTTQQ